MAVNARDGCAPEEAAAVLARRLEDVLAGVMPAARDLTVVDLERTSTGLSRENWLFRALWNEHGVAHERRMILRRDPRASLLKTDRRTEFAVLRALEPTAVPAPAARWVDPEGTVLGSPALIMDVVEGSCDWFVLNGSRPLEARLRLAREFIEILAAIQSVDCATLTLGDSDGRHPPGARAELAFWDAELRRVQLEPLPEMELGFSWLAAHAPAPQATVLVHGDFKPGNALLVEDRVSAMLDWETAHLGDPLEDLGWMTNPVRAREQQIRGHWERDAMVRAFSELTGREVEPAVLRWWNAFSCWKLAAIVLTGVHGFVSGDLDRIYHAPSFLYQNLFELMEE